MNYGCPFPNYISLASGIRLEASLVAPKPSPALREGENKLAVCLHPWSRLGGSMHDPLLESLVETLALHHGFHVLRYNSRGAGRSSGSTSFTGFPEVEDLKDVVQFSVQRIGNVKEVVLIGYSNGSLPVSMHPVLPEPIHTSHVLLSYPLGPRGFLTLFNTRTYQNKLDDLLRDPRAHVLVIYGDADTFTGVDSYDQWTDGLKAVAKSSETQDSGSEAVPGEAGLLSDRLVVKRIEGGTHFWTGNAHRDLVQTLDDFFTEEMIRSAPRSASPGRFA